MVLAVEDLAHRSERVITRASESGRVFSLCRLGTLRRHAPSQAQGCGHDGLLREQLLREQLLREEELTLGLCHRPKPSESTCWTRTPPF